jgi:DNA-binding GntR family transcriptional regulator
MPPMAPTTRSVTKTDVAFETLRTGIEEGRYKPGEHLKLTDLLEELEMSPTPIREAMRLLQAEGLLEHLPHRGVVVRSYSAEQAEEIYRLRSLLEPLATELAVQRASDARVAAIRALCDELALAVGERIAPTNVAELNAAWHRAIYDASESPYLRDFISRLWTALPVRAIWLTSRAADSNSQHAEIMAAIESRDPAEAKRLMKAHIDSGAVSTTRHLRSIGSGQ